MKINFDPRSEYCAIIAPSSRMHSSDDFTRLAKVCFKTMDAHSIKTKCNFQVLHDTSHLFYAAPLEKRTQNLIDFLEDDEVKLIWCWRGGYGASEVAHELLKKNFELKSPKILIGCSDITSLHILFNKKLGIPSIHGEVFNQILRKSEKMPPILDLLQGKSSSFILTPLNKLATRAIQGVITGGNLTVITTIIGTKLHPNFDNAILMLEEVNEAPYSVMRSLKQMEYAGLLKKVKAIVFGDIISDAEHMKDVLNVFAKEIKVPVFKTDGFGHGDINKPFCMGIKGTIDTKNYTLEIPSPFRMDIKSQPET
ncbi:Putative microcin C7 resistance protein [Candidatus Phycorickettsia trachydisci]|uniref:Microcin C7 resistance protein n=1 Tax=Candidatus Phycorickettsia trachydisci TaxID=2115978 RepID=A0A2P1PA05_9RICK|nr:LD-carboxypeptidase [Candidatus Phycorickettsia trachydisci]AVP88089.1 Putative microcin C7 resistance protein [Candidatus Phycorickettsia trachydisci]